MTTTTATTTTATSAPIRIVTVESDSFDAPPTNNVYILIVFVKMFG